MISKKVKMVGQKKEYAPVTCAGCGYSWTPLVPNPKACPDCKRRLSKQRVA